MPHKKARNPDQARRLLRSAGLKARRELGQNFLTDNYVRDEIIEAACLTEQDTVIEVGPGLGILTGELVRVAGRVVAVELDNSLAERLMKKLAKAGNLEVVNADILKMDLNAVLNNVTNYKVVANIPYYITSPVLHYFLHAQVRPSSMVIMMQKEVAEDIAAPPGKYSFISVSMRLFSRPEIVCIVPAKSFYPEPRVDSAVVRFNMLEKPVVEVDDVNRFLDFIHSGFSAPRKKIRNSLMIGLRGGVEETGSLLTSAGIDPSARPGTLNPEEWSKLYSIWRDVD